MRGECSFGMTGYRCQGCRKYSVHQSHRCECGGESFEEAALSGRGKVYSCTTLHASAEPFEKDLPFQIAIIELEEGPRLTARIEGGARRNRRFCAAGGRARRGVVLQARRVIWRVLEDNSVYPHQRSRGRQRQLRT